MKSCALALLALLPAAALGHGHGRHGHRDHGHKHHDDDDVPCWAKEASEFMANATVGLVLPDNSKEIGANVSLAIDADKQYINFEVTLTKGMDIAEQMAWGAVPEPGDGADLPEGVESKDDLWDMLGLDGSESLTLKARMTKEHFSLAVILVNAPNVPYFKDGKSLCIKESMEDLGKDVADAFEQAPNGFDLHQGEPHPHHDEEHVAEEMKGVMPKDKKAAEKELASEYKKDVKKGGHDKIDGDDTYTVDVDDVLEQLEDNFDEVPADAMPPFNVEGFANQSTGQLTNILLTGNDGETKGAKIWVNISSLIFKDVPTSSEPVCKDGQSIDETVAGLMPPPERRLFERAVKLRALESLNGAFSVVRTLRPHTRVPADTTQLWNSKDLEAAKMERHLMQRFHAERIMWQAAHAQYQRKTQMMLAGCGLLLVVMSFASIANRWRRSAVTAGLFEALPRSDSEAA